MRNTFTLLLGIAIALLNTGVQILIIFAHTYTDNPAVVDTSFVSSVWLWVTIIASLVGIVGGWVWALQESPSYKWKMAVLVPFVLVAIELFVVSSNLLH